MYAIGHACKGHYHKITIGIPFVWESVDFTKRLLTTELVSLK